MSDSEFDIKYVANLARIALTPEEEARLGSQLGDILGYVKKLEELDVSDVEPMAPVSYTHLTLPTIYSV